jgi:phosphoribosylanthranilate isomerase
VTAVKVCCIQSLDEARLALRHGASALGLVSAMPSGPGPIDEERIAAIVAELPPEVGSFLLTCLRDVDAIADQVLRCRTNTVQLCDRLERGTWSDLRSALPDVRLVQVIHVVGPESIGEAREAAAHVDALLLDSGNPALAVKELGGTGRRHDWSVSARLVEAVGVPVYLAGGLKPDNVGDAIRTVRPFALDLCTGVRAFSASASDRMSGGPPDPGRLDDAKLERFFAAVRATDEG